MARCETSDSLARLSREITIAGGGLAGLGLAIGLRRRGVPVTVLEAGSYPRHRVCGEFISGTTPATIEMLGLADLLEDARLHRSVSWHRMDEAFFHGTMPEPALGISRNRLDQRMADHFVAMGGTLKTGHRSKPEATDGCVWAAGKKPAGGEWIGIKAHLRLSLPSDLEMHLGGNGYLGLAGIEDGWVNACGLFRIDRSIKESGPALLAAYVEKGGQPGLAGRIASAEYREGSACTIAGFQFGKQAALPGVLALGDSLSLIPPFTGNGMSMALQAAALALDPLARWSDGRVDWQEATRMTRELTRRKFRTRLLASSVIHPVLMSAGGQRAVQQIASRGLLPFHFLLSLIR